MSIIKIDMNSPEFQAELEKTIRFTDKVIEQFKWVYNPQQEIIDGVQLGLTRNKIMYSKRFCPCFMVEEIDGKPQSVENRICPCKPAIEKEIPQDGVCHCQIFCTPEYAKGKQMELETEEIVYRHSRGLTQEECEQLILQKELDSANLTALLEARELGMIDFKLIDVREDMEWQMGHIKGADLLIPTSSFFETLQSSKLRKEEHIIVYCHVGSRSAYCAKILQDMGYTKIGNLTHGILSYEGEIER
jgi:sulfur-carrier protein adenylyltransferase/sulfurtransferase